ncbi:MAG: hypothetical protein JSV49_12140 [Thermoplasmata archaeon]|nr:MAG: hypothetical protein JSV49_12140 [Thermoplasmata archaeon]
MQTPSSNTEVKCDRDPKSKKGYSRPVKRKSNYRYRYKHFHEDRRAVSNIVTSIMMLGIILTILGMVMTIYVPMWARSNEISHMDDAADSFMDLKITIDDQILSNDVGSKFTTRISLGASGGPFLGIGKSTGGLVFDSGKATIMVYQTEDLLNIYGEGGGNLVYTAQNNYYIDQVMIYENGAFIIEQDDKAILKASSDLRAYKDPITNATSIDLNIITLLGNHRNIGGSDDKMIETILTSDMDAPHEFDWYEPGQSYGQNITIQYTTFYPDVWVDYFNDTLGTGSNTLTWDADGPGAGYDGDYYIETSAHSGGDPVLKDATDIFVNLRYIDHLDCEQAVIALNIQ